MLWNRYVRILVVLGMVAVLCGMVTAQVGIIAETHVTSGVEAPVCTAPCECISESAAIARWGVNGYEMCSKTVCGQSADAMVQYYCIHQVGSTAPAASTAPAQVPATSAAIPASPAAPGVTQATPVGVGTILAAIGATALAAAGILSEQDYPRLRKAYTFFRWLIDGLRVVAGNARDRFGYTPLVVGKSSHGWAVTTESCAFPNIGFEVVKQIAPGVTRVAVIRDPATPQGIGQFSAVQSLAASLGLEVSPINARNAGEMERDIAAIARVNDRPEGEITLQVEADPQVPVPIDIGAALFEPGRHQAAADEVDAVPGAAGDGAVPVGARGLGEQMEPDRKVKPGVPQHGEDHHQQRAIQSDVGLLRHPIRFGPECEKRRPTTNRRVSAEYGVRSICGGRRACGESRPSRGSIAATQ